MGSGGGSSSSGGSASGGGGMGGGKGAGGSSSSTSSLFAGLSTQDKILLAGQAFKDIGVGIGSHGREQGNAFMGTAMGMRQFQRENQIFDRQSEIYGREKESVESWHRLIDEQIATETDPKIKAKLGLLRAVGPNAGALDLFDSPKVHPYDAPVPGQPEMEMPSLIDAYGNITSVPGAEPRSRYKEGGGADQYPPSAQRRDRGITASRMWWQGLSPQAREDAQMGTDPSILPRIQQAQSIMQFEDPTTHAAYLQNFFTMPGTPEALPSPEKPQPPLEDTGPIESPLGGVPQALGGIGEQFFGGSSVYGPGAQSTPMGRGGFGAAPSGPNYTPVEAISDFWTEARRTRPGTGGPKRSDQYQRR